MFGLKPKEVMKLSHAQFIKYCIGFNKRQGEEAKERTIHLLNNAYYTAYYVWSKNPDTPKEIFDKMFIEAKPLNINEGKVLKKSIFELNKKLGISK